LEHQAAQAFGRLHLQGLSTHDCNGHSDTVREESATAAVRGDWIVVSSPLGTSVAPTALTALAFDEKTAYIPPPGTDPGTSTPLVLRV
jgi:hypothetical protein